MTASEKGISQLDKLVISQAFNLILIMNINSLYNSNKYRYRSESILKSDVVLSLLALFTFKYSTTTPFELELEDDGLRSIEL